MLTAFAPVTLAQAVAGGVTSLESAQPERAEHCQSDYG